MRKCAASIWESGIERPARGSRHPHGLRRSARACSACRSRSRAGECVCLLGRNGVGKTTTMRSIMGLTPPSAGEVLWRGKPITGWAPHRVAQARHRLRAGGPPHLRRAHRLGEPRCRPPRLGPLGTLDHRDRRRAVSQARRAARPPGRVPVGRRAADADDRAHADGQPGAAAARRALGGAGAAGGRAAARAHRRAEAPGPHHPARRAGRRLLAFARRPGVCSGEGRGALLGRRGRSSGTMPRCATSCSHFKGGNPCHS